MNCELGLLFLLLLLNEFIAGCTPTVAPTRPPETYKGPIVEQPALQQGDYWVYERGDLTKTKPEAKNIVRIKTENTAKSSQLVEYKASQESDSPVITPGVSDYASYISMIREKVQSKWKFPSGLSGLQTVTLRFVLDIDGKLVSVEVMNSTDARLNGSAMEAMNLASPFAPIPESLKKLAGQLMVVKFSVNTKPKESP